MSNISLFPNQLPVPESVTYPVSQPVAMPQPVRKPFPDLLYCLPKSILYHIVEDYCGCDNVFAIERTVRPLHLALQKFWKEIIVSKSLFLYVTESQSIDLKTRQFHRIFKIYETYQETKWKEFSWTSPFPASGLQLTEEDNIQDKIIDNPCKSPFLPSTLREYVYKTNREFLVKFYGNADIASPQSENGNLESLQLSTRGPKALLESRSKEDILFKKIWLQVKMASQMLKKHNDHKKPSNPKEELTKRFTTDSLHLLTLASTYDYRELFTLLQNYRAHQSVLSNEYHHFNNFLLLQNGICKLNLDRLQHLITTLKVDHIKINMQPSSPPFPKDWHLACLHNNGHSIFYGKTVLKSAMDFFYALYFFGSRLPDNTSRTKIQELDVIKVLLSAKANVNEPGIMEYAIKKKHSGLGLLNVLIEGKANVNQFMTKGQTPLGQALLDASFTEDLFFTEGVVSTLLKAKADINGPNIMNQTPLIIAVTSCTDKLFKYLNSYEPDRNLTDSLGQTALMKAVRQKGCVEKIRMLLAPRKVTMILGTKKSKGDLIPISKEEVNRFDDNGETALSHAIKAPNVDNLSYVRLLLEANADVNLISGNDKAALVTLTQTKSFPHAIAFLGSEQPNRKKKRNQQEMATEPTNANKRLPPPHSPLPHSMNQNPGRFSSYPFGADDAESILEGDFRGAKMMDISWLQDN